MQILTRHTSNIDGSWLFEAKNTGAIALLDKDKSWTSFDVVAKIRRLVGVKRIGHAGTLDPLATGLLIVCIGRPATKRISEFQDSVKSYTATIKLGASTVSYDCETPETSFAPLPDCLSIDSIVQCLSSFKGMIDQIPPIYSALKKDGVPLYKLARKGEVNEPSPRTVTIYDIEIVSWNSPLLVINVTCSKGTYIRSLARDIGLRLKTVAYLTDLRRTGSGDFTADSALTITEFEAYIHSLSTINIPIS